MQQPHTSIPDDCPSQPTGLRNQRAGEGKGVAHDLDGTGRTNIVPTLYLEKEHVQEVQSTQPHSTRIDNRDLLDSINAQRNRNVFYSD